MSQPNTPQNPERYDDEIDLLGLLRALLRTWKIWLLTLIVVTGLYGVIQAGKIAAFADEVTYAKPLRLTFPGAHNLEFPNGSPFSYSDIIAPAVVQAAHERNRIGDYGMSAAELQASLSAEPYAPTYPIIVDQYRKLLAQRNLTYEQSSELRTRMQAELDQASRGSVLVSMRLDKAQLPETVASKVLSDIPAIWAERTLRDKGVLNLDIKLASARSLNSELIKGVEYMIIGDLLDEKLELLRGNIEVLTDFEGATTISDPQTGMHLADLSTAISDLSRYVIDELMSPVRYLGLSRDPNVSVFYYEDRLKRLNMDLALLENQADLARQAFDAYLRSERRGAASGGAEAVSPLGMTQLGSDTLDKLLQMSGEGQREAYKQELNQRWLNYNLRAADVLSRIRDTETVVESLRSAADGQGEQTEAQQSYLERVNNNLPGILAQLDGYFGVTERIYQQLSIESVGVRDRLYTPMTNRVLTLRDGLDIKRIILVWLALIFLTSAVVIPVTMIRNAMKKQPEKA